MHGLRDLKEEAPLTQRGERTLKCGGGRVARFCVSLLSKRLVSGDYTVKLNTVLVTFFFSFALFLFWLGPVWDLSERMLWLRQKKKKLKWRKNHSPSLLSLSRNGGSSFLSLVHSPMYWTTSSLLLVFMFFFLSVAWSLKERDEFTADSVWLQEADNGIGWHYRKRLHIDAKTKKKTQTEREYYGVLLSV